MEACEESEKTAKQQLMSSSNKGPVRSRRWSSSTDLEIESTAAAGGGCGSAAILSRSYSTTAVVVAADGGGVKQRARGEEENRRRGGNKLGTGARLSRKLKEQRARFYIVRRCVSMLVCWRDTDDAH